jgi:ABC-type lipoprotein release transport system permease subunit
MPADEAQDWREKEAAFEKQLGVVMSVIVVILLIVAFVVAAVTGNWGK